MCLPRDALLRAIEIAGGQLALAKAIGTTQSNVWTWLNKSRKGVPAGWVLSIEKGTGVSRHDLRPDIYPRDVEPNGSKEKPVKQHLIATASQAGAA